jgi:hypothetical protein
MLVTRTKLAPRGMHWAYLSISFSLMNLVSLACSRLVQLSLLGQMECQHSAINNKQACPPQSW